ncbi:hypothetical protein [Zavarzinella formosa]|uniref:hypothetical protein n=1 Tax=Zavarzinella formosa TaxID=360055 RepID=UPI0002F4E159|nr:hypothetical protein [Zavarzinella formosa]
MRRKAKGVGRLDQTVIGPEYKSFATRVENRKLWRPQDRIAFYENIDVTLGSLIPLSMLTVGLILGMA